MFFETLLPEARKCSATQEKTDVNHGKAFQLTIVLAYRRGSKVVRNLSLFCFCCQVIYLSSNTRLAQLAVPTAGLHSSDRGIIVWPPISLAKAPRCINNCQSSLIKNFFENQSAQVYQTQLFTTCLQSHLFSLFFFLDLYFYTVVVNGSV